MSNFVMRQRFLSPFALLLVILFMCLRSAVGQTGTGIYQFGAYDTLGSETINLGNLNSHINIPVINKPGRGMPFYYNLNYDSLIWTPVTVNGSTMWSLAPNAGWRGQTEITTGYLSYTTLQQNQRSGSTICTTTTMTGYVYHDPFGTAHAFPSAKTVLKAGSCSGNTYINGQAVDGSGYKINVSNAGGALVTAKDGHAFVPPDNTTTGSGTITDSNGNQISTDGSGSFTDTLGMVALAVTGSQSSTESFTYKDTSGTARSVTVNYGAYSVQTAFGCSGVTEFGPQSTQLVSSIMLPDGSAYSFTYEPTPGVSGKVTGRLASITLPSGGVVTYTYAGSNNGISCVDDGPMLLTRTMPNDAAHSTRTYTRTLSTSTSSTAVVDGLNNNLVYGFLVTSVGPIETLREAYNGSTTGTAVLNRVTCYNGTAQSSCQTTVPTLPVTQTDTYEVADGLTERGSTITYDTNGNVTGTTAYDYGTSSARGAVLQSETLTGYGSNGHPDEYSIDTTKDGNGDIISITTATYDQATPTATSGLPQHVAVSAPRGNLTGITQYMSQASSSEVSTGYATYDDAGQVLSSTGVSGSPTTYTYDSSYDAYLTKVALPTVNGMTQTSQVTPDFNTGLTMSTLINGQTTSYTYDSMLRIKTATMPDKGSTTWTYNPIGNVQNNSPANVSVSTLHAGSASITQTTTLDWYGRTQQTDNSDDNGDDLVTYAYDANSNEASVTNPYKSGAAQVLTKATYDVLGRQLSLVEPDCSGSSCSTQTYSPSGNTSLITDEAGNKRKLFMDGVGRITEVLEPDSSNNLTLETDYLYNQNYVNSPNSTPSTYQMVINQKGGSTSSGQWRTRTFTYDLLGRLTSVQTPEAGLTTFTSGLPGSFCASDYTKVCSVKDARGVVATYTYDALSRLTNIAYTTGGTTSAATPSVAYTYDQTSFNGLTVANGLGNRTGMTDGTGSTAWSFDPMGRVTAARKTLQGVTLQANFTYNLDGTVNTLQDFGGTTLTYTYTGAGLQKGVSDQTGRSYASLGTYNAAGQLTGLTHQLTPQSAAIQRSIGYNVRLQPQTIQASIGGSFIQSLTLAYGTAGQNNGNISSITNGMDASHGRDQTYLYDNLNRVKQGGDNAHWGETYTYDNWGNMTGKTQTKGSGYAFSVTASGSNQLSNLQYDLAGNVVQDQLGNAMSYNAESRITAAGTGTYTYDGDGNRVTKTSGGTTTLYWPSAVSGVVDESDAAGTSFGRQIFVAGLRVWSEDIAGTGRFLLHDHLGSTRVTASSSGSVQDDLDYRSFGDITANYGAAPSDNHYVFTGYESDATDSSTDFAQFRNLSSYMGRFTRPDPYMGSYDASNPQSFNRYAYALNRPVMFTDPSGLDVPDGCDDPGVDCFDDGGGDAYGGGGAVCPYDACVTTDPDPDLDPDPGDPGLIQGLPVPNNFCSEDGPHIVRDASVTALSHLNPGQNEATNVTPRDGNFANVANPALINTTSWTDSASAHGSSLQSPTIPGQNIFVVKLYNDPNRGNIIAVVYPNGTMAHMKGLIPFIAGSTSVNVPAARAYLGCPGT